MSLGVLVVVLAGCRNDAEAEADVGVAEEEEVDVGESFEPFERPAELSGEGRWIPGDLHVHSSGASNDTPRHSTPERVRVVGEERGLEFVVLTDHSNSTGSDPWTLEEDPALYNQGPEFPHWDRVAGLSDETFLLVQGNELSPVHSSTALPTGHIGCIPRSLTNFNPNIAFVDRPRGEVTGGEALAQAIAANCFSILNHPYGTAWISYDWTSYDYHAMEVWNGGLWFSLFDERGLKAWGCDLSQGRRVTPVGGSDNHDVESEPPGELLRPAMGVPTTWVWAPGLDWDQIVAGLEVGEVSISDTGTPLDIDVFDGEGRWLAMAGGDVEGGDVTVRLRGARMADGPSEARNLKLYRQPAGVCEDTRSEGQIRVPEPNWEVLRSVPVVVGASFDEQWEVTLEAGDVIFAMVVPDEIGSEQDVSISGPVYVGWE